MSSLLSSARRFAQRLGLDVQRYPAADPLFSVAQMLQAERVDLVLDVGANEGDYATSLRRLGYQGALVSFEPLEEPFARLSAQASQDDAWWAHRLALGDREATVTINVAGNSGTSSSVLPMLERHRAAAPMSAYVGVAQAQQRRLDDVVASPGFPPGDRIFLKMDVQGYERSVLDGAADLLRSGRVAGLQVELSFVPLYDGGMLWQEVFARADDLGMDLVGLIPGFAEPNGRMLQADAVFLLPKVG